MSATPGIPNWALRRSPKIFPTSRPKRILTNGDHQDRRGSEVRRHSGGKVTPKGRLKLRLRRDSEGHLRGKAREVRDNSLKVPHGESRIVVDVKVFSREAGETLRASTNW